MSYQIVIQGAITPALLNAEAQLKHYLSLVVRKLSIGGKSPVKIYLKTRDDYSSEEWSIQGTQGELFLSGGDARGVLYAVFCFLEEFLDIHWWNPFEEYLPDPSEYEFSHIELKGKPFFIMRELCRGEQYANDAGKFSIRNRLNRSLFDVFTAEWGGSYNYGSPSSGHSYHAYIPPAEYGETHPEFFALWEGKRLATTHNQLCLSNDTLLEVIWDKMVKCIEKDEKDASDKCVNPPAIYDFSINDSWMYCQCDKCAKEIKQSGHSGQALRFVNILAGRLKKIRPQLFLSMFAYYNTAEPPLDDTKAEDNVIVRLCDTFSNCMASIYSPENQKYRNQVEAWKKITRNLIIWDYSINYREETIPLPYPNEYLYPEIHKFYADNNVKGIFWEHEYVDVADMHDYKVFLECKYLENPYREDFKDLQHLFMVKYYGIAAPQIINYRELLWQAVQKNHPVLAGFGCVRSDFNYIDLDTLIAIQKEFETARTLARDDAALQWRIKRARLGIDCLAGYSLSEYYQNLWFERAGSLDNFPFAQEEMRQNVNSTWGTACTKLFHPEYSIRNIVKVLNMHQNSKFILPVLPENPAEYRIIQVTKEMLGVLSGEIEFQLSDSPDLAVINKTHQEVTQAAVKIAETTGGDYDFPIEYSVNCLTLGRDVIKKEILKSEVTINQFQDYSITFTMPSYGCSWYFGKSRAFEVRLDYLKMLGMDLSKELTVLCRIKFTDYKIIIGGISVIQRKEER